IPIVSSCITSSSSKGGCWLLSNCILTFLLERKSAIADALLLETFNSFLLLISVVAVLCD
ncbi:unnamed protein product, partial [Musa textilis]